ncbi:MAG: hypothetical protein ACC707_12785 [Thiohalomonadales bacterium]
MKCERLLSLSLIAILLMANTDYAFALCSSNDSKAKIQAVRSKHTSTKVHAKIPFSVNTKDTQIIWRGKRWQADYEFLNIDYPSGIEEAPITNGYLHMFRGGYAGKLASNNSSVLLWEILPTLAVSSNQLKNPSKIELGSFRIDAHLIWKVILQKFSYHVGVCSNALTGEYLLIPALGIAFQDSHWALSIAYPRSSAAVQLNSVATLFSGWSLSGNVWEILDSELQNRSDLQFESQKLEIGLRFRYPDRGVIEFGWSYRFEQQLRYLARNGSQQRVHVGNNNGWNLSYKYLL